VTVSIVSASAGSGKTYRLAKELEEALSGAGGGAVVPEAVLATTFTNKAAAELQERARRFLLEKGHVDLARRLAAARFGTVNAVCGRLVSDFALELGRPPDQGVLDEVAAHLALRRALSRVLTVEETFEIAELERRLKSFRILDSVQRVIELARANRIPAEAFSKCSRRSHAQVRGLLDTPEASGDPESTEATERALDDGLRDALQDFVDGIDAGVDTTQGARDAAQRIRQSLLRLQRGLDLFWDEWAHLARLGTRKASQRLMDRVHTAAERYLAHPRLHRDLERASELVCSLAERGLRAYEDHKRSTGVVDFVDQEALALELLEREDVRERLRGELGLVLVDEFQDTSPLQLAIFLRLAELSPRSLWVGDQKQSIFAFRGSDPALMESAIAGLLEGGEPSTLGRSYRSRPALVRATSDLFARAFGRHGLPRHRVLLEPEKDDEPSGLGPVAERWRLSAANLREDAHALAAATAQLLADDSVRVRDTVTGLVRRAEARDVAILCRRRAAASDVAAALQAIGIRSVLPRSGLLGTAEGQTILAGLRLWADPRDTLAAAAIARLAELPGDGEEWLATALARPKSEAFFEMPRVARLLAVRKALAAAGPLQAVDGVREALELDSLCADWGESSARLANLDALRAHATVFAELAQAEGAGSTPAGLVGHLEQLEADKLDAQATLTSENAVTVSTWHGAKGLEWPIVVLFELDKVHDANVFGISVERESREFDPRDPLAGSWLRIWPEIFTPRRSRTTVHDRLATHTVAGAARERRDQEDLRLLYVGWTRARDRVILAGRSGKLLEGILRHLSDESGLVLDDPESGPATWGTHTVELVHRAASPLPPAPRDPQPGILYAATGPREHPPAWLQPSALETPGRIEGAEPLGPRIEVSGSWDENRLGEVFHRFFAADDPALSAEDRLALASGIIRRWSLTDNLAPATLLEASNRLRAWCESKFPGAAWRREWPLSRRDASGTILRGAADLVLETADSLAVVDHKTFPGSLEAAVEKARGFAGQVWSYADALREATGKAVVGCYVHLPIAGTIVRVERGMDLPL
jgi:ATP-dependent exoDNAse (exonuclease V) beta subunit